MNFFPSNDSMDNKIVFEKSATYFDADIAPKRVQALLPNVKLVSEKNRNNFNYFYTDIMYILNVYELLTLGDYINITG